MEKRGSLIGTSSGEFDFTVERTDVSHLDVSNEKQNADIIALLLESWICLLADSPLNKGMCSLKPRRVFARFKRDFLTGPLKEFVLEYASYADEIVSTTSLYGASSLTGRWLPEMRNTPIFKEYHLWYYSGDPVLLKFILSFLYFGKKLSYEDSGLNAVALREWLGTEQRLSSLRLDEQITAGMALITSNLVSGFEIEPVWPKFGPGKVSERGISGVIDKANNLVFDAKIDYLFFRGLLSGNSAGVEGVGLRREWVLPDPDRWSNASKVTERVSRQKFVPKDVGKTRTICMEPNTFMFFQQAVMRSLIRAMDQGNARRFVSINDQRRNQRLARYGSAFGEIDTIDLSSASDSVSVELVKALFPKRVLAYLLGTRTSKVRTIDRKVVEVKKFAPMGSALCFPVQCLVFTTVVIYAAMLVAHGCADGESLPLDSPWLKDVDRSIRRLFRNKPGPRLGSGPLFEPAAIYGDDICCDGKLTATVTHLLTLLGFKVNTEKSFTGSCAFRESCGKYYHDGEDVTPLRFRVRRYWGKIGPKSVASMLAGCKLAGDNGYFHYRKLLVQRLLFGELEGVGKYHGRNSFKFVNDRNLSYGIFTTSEPRNDHLDVQYNVDLQRDERRCIMLTRESFRRPSKIELWAVEHYLHTRWWGSRAGVVSGDFTFPASRNGTSGTRLIRNWLPD